MNVSRVFCLFLVAGMPLIGQTAKDTQTKTKIEAFEAKTGAVVIQGFTKTGMVKDRFGGGVEVEAVELMDATSGLRVSGVKINVKAAGALETQNSSFVDADEIESLIKGIDYISKLDASVTKMNSFQADYRTKGDLDISTFSSADGKISSAVTSGTIGQARVFLTQGGLAELRSLVVEANTQLQAAH
jgi:hypothetical protein